MGQNFDLSGKVALISGASSGLGAHFARVVARHGATAVLAARRRSRLEELAAEINGEGGRAVVLEVDVTQVAAMTEAVAEVAAAHGGINILINNSGVSAGDKTVSQREDDYDRVMDTNLKGAFFLAQAVGWQMIERRIAGRILNIASAGALRVMPGMAVYAMSKAALVQMTKALAVEWARFDIAVNALCPGYISTELNSELWQTDAGKNIIAKLPRRRLGQPEFLDDLVLTLCSDRGGFINGAVISADDGWSTS